MSRERKRGPVCVSADARDQIWPAIRKQHLLAFEARIRQETPEMLRAGGLLAGWIDRVETDQFRRQLHGTYGHTSAPSCSRCDDYQAVRSRCSL
jgi:hypothetical protein